MTDITPEELRCITDLYKREPYDSDWIDERLDRAADTIERQASRIAELEAEADRRWTMIEKTQAEANLYSKRITELEQMFAAVCDDNEACGRRIAELEQQVSALRANAAVADEMHDTLRDWWRFDGQQQPLSSWHDREEFIRRWDAAIDAARENQSP